MFLQNDCGSRNVYIYLPFTVSNKEKEKEKEREQSVNVFRVHAGYEECTYPSGCNVNSLSKYKY